MDITREKDIKTRTRKDEGEGSAASAAKDKEQGQKMPPFPPQQHGKKRHRISIVVYNMRFPRPMEKESSNERPKRGSLISMHACLVSCKSNKRFVKSICDEAVSWMV